MADLDEIMSGQGEAMPAPEGTTEQPQQTGEQPDNAAAGDDGAPMVPRAALEDERAKRRKYTDEVADIRRQFGDFQQQFSGFMQSFQAPQRPQAQPQPQQPSKFADPLQAVLDDPRGLIQHEFQQQIAPVTQTIQDQREAFSRMMAVDKFGEDAVNTARAELAQRLQRDPSAQYDYQRIMASPHPFGALVQWHQNQSALSEIGTDPKAYREKVRAELLAEFEAGQHQPPAHPMPGAQAPAVMPTSFAAARSAGPRSTPQYAGPMALSDIMKR